MALSKELAGVIELLRKNKNARKGKLIPAQQIPLIRAQYDQSMGNFPMPETINIREEGMNGLSGERYLYSKEDKNNDYFLFYIHGGGFETGSARSRRYLAANLCSNLKADGFSADYPQWPEGKHPDGLNAVLKVYQEIQKLGFSADHILLAGESGGAVLCLTMTHYLKDHCLPLPGCLCLFGPLLNVAERYPSRNEREERDPMLNASINEELRYFDLADRKSPYVSACYGDFKNFPPTVITVGTEEVLYDDAVKLHEYLDEVNAENRLYIYEGLFHTFQCIPCPESEQSIKDVSDTLLEWMNRS